MLWFLYPSGMGLGDVKLAGVLGMYLGYLGWGTLAVGAFFGFALGAVIGITLMALGRATRKSKIPFGPFMLAGRNGCSVLRQLARARVRFRSPEAEPKLSRPEQSGAAFAQGTA